jgi:GxxExxY protein
MSALAMGTPRRGVHLWAMDIEEAARIIVDAGFQIHRKLGPGLMESVYHAVYARDLPRRGLFVESKKPISFDYEGMSFENAFTPDIIVERQIVMELKSVLELKPVHYKQLLTYMRLSGCRMGFLINFKTALFKDGVKRLVL